MLTDPIVSATVYVVEAFDQDTKSEPEPCVQGIDKNDLIVLLLAREGLKVT